ncbi:MAG: anthranilate phosphoribosyltransferase [Sebaldella sp.]|nr:anthranilate phosphoribosyltransferase [Sebaldella sp.]
MLRKYIVKLQDKERLSNNDFEEIVKIIADKSYDENQLSALLVLISEESLTPEGLAAFVKNILKYSSTFEDKKAMIDVCGTGGDGFKTINISTTTAFICGALGVTVAKHGNRAVSSRSGSSDILDILNVPLESSIDKQQHILKNQNLSFFHAPYFHKLVGEVKTLREKLGVRTVFNILGPLLHPNLSLKYQLVGIYHKPVQNLYAETLRHLGREHALIVRGNDGLDEISITADTEIIEVKQNEIKKFSVSPEEYGFKRAPHNEITGGNPGENAEILINILSGREKGAKRDIVVLNSMFALYTSDFSDSPEKAKTIIENALDSGHIYDYFRNYIDFLKEVS